MSLSISNLAVAQSNLRTSAANYVRLIGHEPRRLTKAKILYKLPRTLRRAIAIAERTNPNILAALHLEDATDHNIKAVKGQLLPTLSVTARYQYRNEPSTTTSSSETASLVGTLQVPLYQGGRVYSRSAKPSSNQASKGSRPSTPAGRCARPW